MRRKRKRQKNKRKTRDYSQDAPESLSHEDEMSRRRQKRLRGEKPKFSGYKPAKVEPRSEHQAQYVNSINANDLVLCHGPAGTGKTHLAAGMAVKMMRAGGIEKIVLCRPVVGVGKDIGFLPGTKEDKVGPYLTPLFDEMSYYCENSLVKEWMDQGKLEIVPLSMMRGRTFNDCFVILDEAQNASMMELRMLMTRLGVGSTMVISGDLTQSDLPEHQRGAFNTVVDRLNHVESIGVVQLTNEDIVRHQLIGVIESLLNTSPVGDFVGCS